MKFTGHQDSQVEVQIRLLHQVLIARLHKNAPLEARALMNQVLAHVEVKLSPKLRTTAGRAWLKKNRVELHYELLKSKPEDLEVTYAHELGHLLCYAVFKTGGHRSEWKRVMAWLESNDERCHSMDTRAWARPKKVLKRFSYKCATEGCGKEYMVTPQAHAKAERRVRQYTEYCGYAGQPIKSLNPNECTGFRCRKCNKPIPLQNNPVEMRNPRLDRQSQAA